jgi:hypothetical protein
VLAQCYFFVRIALMKKLMRKNPLCRTNRFGGSGPDVYFSLLRTNKEQVTIQRLSLMP